MTDVFTIRGDELWFGPDLVGCLVVPEGTLRGRVVEELDGTSRTHAEEVGYQKARAYYDLGYSDGYDEGLADGREQ